MLIFTEIGEGVFDIFSTTASTVNDNIKDNTEDNKDLEEELGIESLNDLGIAGIKFLKYLIKLI